MFKSRLNEHCQKNNLKSPLYEVEKPSGPAHRRIYRRCVVKIGNIYSIEIEGECSGKKEMENKSAEIILRKFSDWKNIKSELKKDRGMISLVDFDNSADVDIDSLDGEVVIFVSSNFNLGCKKMRSLGERNNVEIIRAEYPLPEMVDHMMTWFACKNIERFEGRRAAVFSKDAGLNALVHILKDAGVDASFNSPKLSANLNCEKSLFHPSAGEESQEINEIARLR